MSDNEIPQSVRDWYAGQAEEIARRNGPILAEIDSKRIQLATIENAPACTICKTLASGLSRSKGCPRCKRTATLYYTLISDIATLQNDLSPTL